MIAEELDVKLTPICDCLQEETTSIISDLRDEITQLRSKVAMNNNNKDDVLRLGVSNPYCHGTNPEPHHRDFITRQCHDRAAGAAPHFVPRPGCL